MSALSSVETTQTGVAPPLSAYCVAKPPRPPEAPQIRTLSPCFMSPPFLLTSWRYAVQLTRPGEAASSQVRCAGLGISWLALTSAMSARPPKLVSKPQIRCSRVEHRVVVPVGRPPARPRGSARRPRSPGFHWCTPGPVREHDAGQVGADHVVRQVVPLGQRREPAVALEEAERRHRLEDRGPDGVVVDRARHHRDQRLARAELGQRARPRRAATCAGPCRGPPCPRTCRPRPCAPSRRGRTRGGRGWRSPPARCRRRGWRRGSAARAAPAR